MVALAQAMTDDFPARPVLVLSNDPDATGLQKAADVGIDTAVVDHKQYPDRSSFECALSIALAQVQPDIICLAGFMRILTPSFTEQWADRMLNIHPSLLPKHKGLHTHARALANGDAQHGCSVHRVTAKLDDGPILGQAKLTIAPDDTPSSLAARVLPLEHALYPAVLQRFAVGDLRPVTIMGE